jgi:hypothetical protein
VAQASALLAREKTRVRSRVAVELRFLGKAGFTTAVIAKSKVCAT